MNVANKKFSYGVSGNSQTDRRNIPLEKVKGAELNTSMTSKKLVVDIKNDSVKFKINRPGKSECLEDGKWLRQSFE